MNPTYFRKNGKTYMIKNGDLYMFVPTMNSGMGEMGGFFKKIKKLVKKVAKVAAPAISIASMTVGVPPMVSMIGKGLSVANMVGGSKSRNVSMPYNPMIADQAPAQSLPQGAPIQSNANGGGYGSSPVQNAFNDDFPALPNTENVAPSSTAINYLPLILIGGLLLLTSKSK